MIHTTGGGCFPFYRRQYKLIRKELGETTMDEFFVQGVVGGVLNRHKNRTLDSKRIATLSVEIAANIDRATQFTDVKATASDNPLNIKMWKGYDGIEKPYDKEYLEYWTCDLCGDHTHEVDYDYLGNNRNHLKCELEYENEYNAHLDKGRNHQMELKFPKEK